jgi:hypothetical protein
MLSGSAGIYSFADIPYFYTDIDQNNNFVLEKGYSQESFIPFEVGVNAKYKINSKWLLNMDIKYTENYFFFVNNMYIGFKYLIL